MAQSARTKHLKALGLPDTADDASIKKAFRKLALMYHPDRNPTNVEEATERFKQINEANTYLTSAAGRVRTPPAPEPAPTRPPPRRRPPAPHRPPPSEKPKPKPTEEEADLKRAQRHHAAAEARRQVQERETRRRASAAAARKREADDLAAQMAANEKRQNDRQRKDSINAAKAREAERNRQQEKLRNEARVKREREEEIRRRRQEAEDREQERIRRERFEVHAREAREREQQREAARAEKLRRARSDPFPRAHDDDIETHDMTEDDEAWSARGVPFHAIVMHRLPESGSWVVFFSISRPFRARRGRGGVAAMAQRSPESSRDGVGSRRWRGIASMARRGTNNNRDAPRRWRSQQKNNTRGMSTSAWRTEPEEEDPEEAARRAHAEAFAAAARARSAGELAEAERLYAKAQQQMDAARDHRKKQTEAAAKKAKEEGLARERRLLQGVCHCRRPSSQR
uniref:J domain-containing protein n=1 Tax=Pelagomonas calceolata TaxID=35677 RepID=A0A7S4E9K1_9STRA